MSRAAELMRGLEPQALREKAKKLGLRLLNSELGGRENEDALAAMLMLEEPELLRYQEARQLMLAEFIGEISEQLCQRGAESRIIPSAVPFDINKVYLEGLSFSAAEGKAGMWMPLVYGPGETYGMVRNTIRLFDSQTSVGMAATLLREADRDSFCATLLTARASGCDTFFIYNYSLASQERLSWVAKFNEALLA
jgi:hypothetical protein